MAGRAFRLEETLEAGFGELENELENELEELEEHKELEEIAEGVVVSRVSIR